MRRAGYKMIEKYIDKIKSPILASFSFMAVPKNEKKISENLKSALEKSNLLK